MSGFFSPPREAKGPFEIVSEYDSGKFDLGIIVSSKSACHMEGGIPEWRGSAFSFMGAKLTV